MINPLERIKGNVSGSKEFKVDDLIQVRHDMMCVYGWISQDEFKKLPIPVIWDLHKLVQKEKKIMYNTYQATMGAAGMKKNQISEVFR